MFSRHGTFLIATALHLFDTAPIGRGKKRMGYFRPSKREKHHSDSQFVFALVQSFNNLQNITITGSVVGAMDYWRWAVCSSAVIFTIMRTHSLILKIMG
jgi:hypothetical protein